MLEQALRSRPIRKVKEHHNKHGRSLFGLGNGQDKNPSGGTYKQYISDLSAAFTKLGSFMPTEWAECMQDAGCVNMCRFDYQWP